MRILAKTSVARMESEFLQAEWYSSYFHKFRSKINDLVTHPDVTDAEQNALRKKLLWQARGPLLKHIPLQTEWNIVQINNAEFGRLMFIKDSSWIRTFGERATIDSAAKCLLNNKCHDCGVDFNKVNSIKKLIGRHTVQNKLICISQDIREPLTLLEGNHRALALGIYFLETGVKDFIPTRVILGTSQLMNQVPWLNR